MGKYVAVPKNITKMQSAKSIAHFVRNFESMALFSIIQSQNYVCGISIYEVISTLSGYLKDDRYTYWKNGAYISTSVYQIILMNKKNDSTDKYICFQSRTQ